MPAAEARARGTPAFDLPYTRRTDRRKLSLVLAAVLSVVVVATIFVSRSNSSRSSATVVRGAVDPESRPFFADPRVQTIFKQHELDMRINDASVPPDFSVDGAPSPNAGAGNPGVTPFYSPLAVATFRDIAVVLQHAGLAHDHGGWWSLDTARYLDLVRRRVRWNQLPGNSTYHSVRPVLIATPGTETDTTAMYAALAGYLANGSAPLESHAEVDKVVNAVSPLFLEQGSRDPARGTPFDEYLSLGETTTPMVLVEEAEFVQRAMIAGGKISPNMVLMYPDPDVLVTQTLLARTPAGARVAALLTDDPTLQTLAAADGLRTPAHPGTVAAVAQRHHVALPSTVGDVIEAPTAQNLEALMVRIEATLLAARGSVSP
jgi:hypothetical protein